MLICPNVVVTIANEISRKRKMFNFGTLKRIVFPVNTEKRNGKTFIAGANNAGNHWVLVIVELRPFKRIIYCDTLAWIPHQIFLIWLTATQIIFLVSEVMVESEQ